jgi:chromosome condensin MukBEF complex kleisin-like MukF subunit
LFFCCELLPLIKRRKKAVMTNHRYNNYFQTSYDRETYQAIRKMSMKKGISMQDVVRQAVTHYLENDGELETNENDYESDERDTKYVSKRKSMFK